MKKLLLMFFVCIVFTSASSCNPDSGFDWCYDSTTEGYGDTICHAEVQGTYPKCSGEVSGSRCVGEWTIDIKGGDDNLYLYKGLTTYDGFWDNVARCSSSGCAGERFSGGVKHNILLSDSSGRVPGYVIAGWDYDRDSDGNWCWQSEAGGYTVDFFNLKSVECISQEECSGKTFIKCENYKMVNKGLVKGKCGVECVSDENCGGGRLFTTLSVGVNPDDLFCSNNELKKRTDENFCSNNLCDSRKITVTEQVCDFECRVVDGKSQCLEEPPLFENPIFLIVGSIIILLVIGLIVWFIRSR